MGVGLYGGKTAALRLTALAAVVALAACSAPAKKQVVAPAPAPEARSGLTQRILGEGLYEMVWSPAAKAIYVASAQKFNNDNGGIIYRLNPQTLATEAITRTDLKNFGMAVNEDGSAFYATNTMDGGVTKFDGRSGKVLQRLVFSDKDKDGEAVGTREILYHNNQLFIGGVADPGFISVVDARSMKLKARIKNAGKWVTGIIYSQRSDRIYATNGSGQILVINPRSYRIEQRWTTGDSKEYLLLNLAEDPASGRIFATDDSQAKTTLVFDARSGKVIKRLPGDALGIKFNPKRNEIYISQRGAKKVLQLDGTSYAVKNSWSFDTFPNSLLVAPDGQSLYVTVKQDIDDNNRTKGPDTIVRIALN